MEFDVHDPVSHARRSSEHPMHVPAPGVAFLKDPQLCAMRSRRTTDLAGDIVIARHTLAVPPTALDALGALLQNQSALMMLQVRLRQWQWQRQRCVQQPYGARHAVAGNRIDPLLAPA